MRLEELWIARLKDMPTLVGLKEFSHPFPLRTDVNRVFDCLGNEERDEESAWAVYCDARIVHSQTKPRIEKLAREKQAKPLQ